MTTLPEDFECLFGLDDASCYAKQGKFSVDPFDGYKTCILCGWVHSIESDLDSPEIYIDDPYSQAPDDDNDGNVDNPETSNVQDLAAELGTEDTPEEKMAREIKLEFIKFIDTLQAYPNVDIEAIKDAEEREHYRGEEGVARGLAAYVQSNLDSLVSLYMHFSHHGPGPNVFPPKEDRRPNRALVILLHHREINNHIVDSHRLIEILGKHLPTIKKLHNKLLRAVLSEGKTETTHYIKLYADFLDMEIEKTEQALSLWEDDLELLVIAEPKVKAIAWLLAFQRVFLEKKDSIAATSASLGLPSRTVSSRMNVYRKHLQTIKTAL